jgi:hypothetical protein
MTPSAKATEKVLERIPQAKFPGCHPRLFTDSFNTILQYKAGTTKKKATLTKIV